VLEQKNMKHLFSFENKIGYSEIIAILALLLSVFSLFRSCSVEKDNRALSHLDLRPNLRLSSFLKEIPGTPAHFTIHNAGPIDAIQVEVQVSILGVSTESSEITRAAIVGSENPIIISKLNSLESKSFRLPLDWLIRSCQLRVPPKYNVVEILVKYIRESDRALYAERAFYYLNPNNQLVTEYDNSLPSVIYKPIIKAAHNSTALKLAKVATLNELNPVDKFIDIDTEE
jgi:hypothetical protein